MNPLQLPRLWNADLPVIKAFALNIFQNCNITNSVKNRLNSYVLSPLYSPNENENKSVIEAISECCIITNTPSKITVNRPPTPKMFHDIGLEIIKSVTLRGLSFITECCGGSDANAMAAKVSIIRFTQSICVTVSGDSVPINAPISTIRQAATLIVI